MAKITLPSGVTIEGDAELVKYVVTTLEDGVHYFSSTKGKIPIKDMASQHIKNAILKKLEFYAGEVRTKTPKEFVAAFKKGFLASDITALALLKELSTRSE